jgi:hypothetical protein
MPPDPVLDHVHGFRRVILATGHLTDDDGRPEPRFPESAVASVRNQIREQLRRWQVSSDDLLICGGARGADLLIADEGHQARMAVWMLLADDPNGFEVKSVGTRSTWSDIFWHLLGRVPSFVLDHPAPRESRYAAANQWMIDVATRQALDDHPISVLAVWNRSHDRHTGGTADMIKALGNRSIELIVIDPLAPAATATPDATRSLP